MNSLRFLLIPLILLILLILSTLLFQKLTKWCTTKATKTSEQMRK